MDSNDSLDEVEADTDESGSEGEVQNRNEDPDDNNETFLSFDDINEDYPFTEPEDLTRRAKGVIPVVRHKLKMNELYDDNNIPKTIILREHFRREGRLEEEVALRILSDGAEILKAEDNLLILSSPIIIVGDIHGQYYDLLKIFELGGTVLNNVYLFLGDYVDRGYFSVECLLYLLALKKAYPESIYLLRGNHESLHITRFFTFQKECKVKYSMKVYEAALEVFNSLPIAALVNDEYLCIHGGLSPEIHTLQDIQNLDRFMEPPSHGPFCDLLWSDPCKNYGKEKSKEHFLHNTTRGCAYFFSYDAVCSFLKANDLACLIRAHEAMHDGYQIYKETKQGFPSMVTVFSCPNYCDAYKNKGAIIVFDKENFHIKQFTETPHPYWLPDFVDGFTWSLPFAGEKITNILIAVLNICSNDELVEDAQDNVADTSKHRRKSEIRSKILTVGKMANGYKQMRVESEKALKWGSLTPPSRTSSSSSSDEGSPHPSLPDMDHELSFEEAKEFDVVNEKMPPRADPSAGTARYNYSKKTRAK